MSERLQKILARAGYGSRRSVEALISGGRVTVNGKRAVLGQRADTGDRVAVDGVVIEGAPAAHVYLALNKPAGYTTTAGDRHAEHTVMELLPNDLPPHVLPVGRLDRDSEGLLIFTNDGDLAHRLAHPRYQVEKEYRALVQGVPTVDALARLRSGVVIDGKPTARSALDVVHAPPGFGTRAGHTWLRVVIHEGRNRQVRRMCFAVGHVVRELVRTRIGPVMLGRLRRGQTRPLTTRELSALRRLLDMAGGE